MKRDAAIKTDNKENINPDAEPFAIPVPISTVASGISSLSHIPNSTSDD